MRIVEPRYMIEFISPHQDIWRMAKGARACYQSEDKSDMDPSTREDLDRKLIAKLINNGHWSPLEHSSVTVRFITDIGVANELTRHRLASFSQESTRYCNYSKGKFGSELTFVRPSQLHKDLTPEAWDIWTNAMTYAEEMYMAMLDKGYSPQIARAVLPKSLKTELIVTANLREWYHILDLRTSRAAHPDIRYLTLPLLVELGNPYCFPDIFGDLSKERTDEYIEDYRITPDRKVIPFEQPHPEVKEAKK